MNVTDKQKTPVVVLSTCSKDCQKGSNKMGHRVYGVAWHRVHKVIQLVDGDDGGDPPGPVSPPELAHRCKSWLQNLSEALFYFSLCAPSLWFCLIHHHLTIKTTLQHFRSFVSSLIYWSKLDNIRAGAGAYFFTIMYAHPKSIAESNVFRTWGSRRERRDGPGVVADGVLNRKSKWVCHIHVNNRPAYILYWTTVRVFQEALLPDMPQMFCTIL